MRTLTFVGLVACVTTLAGCGEDKPKPGGSDGRDDSQKIVSLLTEFTDNGSATTMTGYFVKGTKLGPAEYKKYVAHTYAVDGKAAVAGDAATANVKVTTAAGKEIGSKEWAFAKEGANWKLKSAPLP